MSNIDTLDLPAETSSSANTLIESQQPDERQEADIADDASTPEARFEEKPRIVTRYSREELLALQKSPLITRPDTLPALSAWFG
ncbi:hypothetical protein BC936DRAFT_138532 [Jimgerdemannia flammicorona]|uniref:Uncharacterized protein n=2 Tax=Jimgerdemannia flammicorona TaxID=994334 RepID=A0A433Q7F4_9FUNG|nr:hypothetical protein BC936DRAFT_138532 [Jimgerdemannia flammicorona]RUS25689.1 hypothetical protein BC938DRAFT_471789 [Jimgerdemannia flammicorona]